MQRTAHKFLKDAKAGYYNPTLFGTTRSFFQSYTNLEQINDITVLADILLLDISFYQVSADFMKMASECVRGVIIRAGQNLWEDIKAKDFMTNATKANMPFGSYWYYDSRKSPLEQANKWKEVLGTFDTRLYCWADYEESYNGAYAGYKYLKDFLEICKKIMPDRKFGIYTGYYYWMDHSPLLATELSYFSQYPLWLAWYVTNPAYVKIPKPWTNLTLWQKSAKGDGTKYGVGSLNVDVNQFIGTMDEFNNTFGLSGSTGVSMQVIKGIVKQNVLLRSGPSTAYPTFTFNGKDYIPQGSTIEAVYPNQAQWLNITKINNLDVGNTTTWASAGASQQYIGWEVVSDTPTEPPVVTKTPFTLTVSGYKPFSGELESE